MGRDLPGEQGRDDEEHEQDGDGYDRIAPHARYCLAQTPEPGRTSLDERSGFNSSGHRQLNRTRGSMYPYKTSTTRFTKMNTAEATITTAWTTW